MMEILCGTSGFGYKEWVGNFYPEKTPPREMLGFYAQRFPTVEINNTFYRMPSGSLLAAWAEQVPPDFIFAFKAPQKITHLKRLKDVGEETVYFFRVLTGLEQKRGPVLFQFPGHFGIDLGRLKAFLDLIPPPVSCAFEFRSLTWITEETLDLLRARNHCLCLADGEETPAGEMIATTSWGYLRLRRSDYTDGDLDYWVERIRSQSWKKAFVFFKHPGEGSEPKTALRFQDRIGVGGGKTAVRNTRRPAREA